LLRPMIIYLVRVVVLLFLLRLLFRFVAGILRGLQGGPSPNRRAPSKGVPLVRDRVCNTFLPRDRALRATIGGHDEYFCSERCRDRAVSKN
jgi:hypothetical protein